MIRTNRSEIVAADVVGFAKFPCDRWHWQTYGCGHEPETLCLMCYIKTRQPGDTGDEWEVLEAPDGEEMGVCRECKEIF